MIYKLKVRSSKKTKYIVGLTWENATKLARKLRNKGYKTTIVGG